MKGVIDVENDYLLRAGQDGVVVGDIALKDHHLAPGLRLGQFVGAGCRDHEAVRADLAVRRGGDETDVVLSGEVVGDVPGAHGRPGHLGPKDVGRQHDATVTAVLA